MDRSRPSAAMKDLVAPPLLPVKLGRDSAIADVNQLQGGPQPPSAAMKAFVAQALLVPVPFMKFISAGAAPELLCLAPVEERPFAFFTMLRMRGEGSAPLLFRAADHPSSLGWPYSFRICDFF